MAEKHYASQRVAEKSQRILIMRFLRLSQLFGFSHSSI